MAASGRRCGRTLAGGGENFLRAPFAGNRIV